MSNESRLKDSFEGFLASSLRMGGCYWTATALNALNGGNLQYSPRRDELIEFIRSCENEEEGGYGQDKNFDAHITSTHYAVLILKQLNALEIVQVSRMERFLAQLQNADGSMRGDLHSEDADLRFVYNAVAIMSILKLSKDCIDLNSLLSYLNTCKDRQTHAFSPIPGAEPHAAYTYCAVAALAILDRQFGVGNIPDSDDKLGFWLAERQTELGGFNGRPEKAPDVCYSWWILATMEILRISDFIDRRKLRDFVIKSQDAEDGGISDRPGFAADVFHTFFGIASLSLLGEAEVLGTVDPVYAIVL